MRSKKIISTSIGLLSLLCLAACGPERTEHLTMGQVNFVESGTNKMMSIAALDFSKKEVSIEKSLVDLKNDELKLTVVPLKGYVGIDFSDPLLGSTVNGLDKNNEAKIISEFLRLETQNLGVRIYSVLAEKINTVDFQDVTEQYWTQYNPFVNDPTVPINNTLAIQPNLDPNKEEQAFPEDTIFMVQVLADKLKSQTETPLAAALDLDNKPVTYKDLQTAGVFFFKTGPLPN